MEKYNYSKPVLTIEQQVELLESRGLCIPDKKFAMHVLKNTNYYRLSAYTLPFETGMKDGRREHKFRTDATFERIIRLYQYDEKLRTLLFSLVCEIEIYFRSRITHVLAVNHNDAFIIYNKAAFKDIREYKELLDSLSKEIERSRETFVSHFKCNYIQGKENKLPIWAAVETISLGTLSKLYKSMLPDDKMVISNELNIPGDILSSWLHTISYIRNICAHNGRIINRFLAIGMKLPYKVINKITKWQKLDNKRIFNLIVTMEYIIKKTQIYETDSLRKLDKIYSTINEFLTLEPSMRASLGLHKDIESKQFFNDKDIK